MKKWIKKIITWAMLDEDQEGSIPEPRPIGLIAGRNHTKNPASLSGENGLNCTLYKAAGGTIVEFRTYDMRTDRNNSSLHVIPDSEDFGDTFSKIVTVELMRM